MKLVVSKCEIMKPGASCDGENGIFCEIKSKNLQNRIGTKSNFKILKVTHQNTTQNFRFNDGVKNINILLVALSNK